MLSSSNDERWLSLQILGLHSLQPIGNSLCWPHRVLRSPNLSAQVRHYRGFHSKVPVPSHSLLRELPRCSGGNRAREAGQALAAAKKDCFDRETQSTSAGPCRQLGSGNAVSRTELG